MRWVCYGLNLLGDPALEFKYLNAKKGQSSQQSTQSITTTTTTPASTSSTFEATTSMTSNTVGVGCVTNNAILN